MKAGYSSFEELLMTGSASLMAVFFVTLITHLRPKIFMGSYGKRHRVAGLVYLICLIGNFAVALKAPEYSAFGNLILGVMGIVLTLTAAYDFKKAHQSIVNRNAQTGTKISGTLDEEATVTFSEMREHSFYQALNLTQICYLHALHRFLFASGGPLLWLPGQGGRAPAAAALGAARWVRGGLALLATLPWAWRHRFPVNRFSDNYPAGAGPPSWTALLYRVKKYQYVFYKHFLLHGLNASAALCGEGGAGLATSRVFQLYWVGLNTAYVMEFFLQSLVKRRHMGQRTMLLLNQTLMVASSVPALQVLRHCSLRLAAISLVLNFVNRKKEIQNMIIVLGAGYIFYYHQSP